MFVPSHFRSFREIFPNCIHSIASSSDDELPGIVLNHGSRFLITLLIIRIDQKNKIKNRNRLIFIGDTSPQNAKTYVVFCLVFVGNVDDVR